ncbi:MAG: hypothetical protein IPL65_02420 [Lewinellaceae bacterium]|nr:hypothetical protein [Lewinellaceae bacterium]
MKFPWFIQIGIFYLPKSIPGWLMVTAALTYAVYIFLDIDSRSHSASDTLMNFAVNLVLIGAVYTLIAFFTSKKQKTQQG